MADERPARDRAWVKANRLKVHEATQGRVGYIHIPDMGPRGYAKFHRALLVEYEREGLIIDVRFNGGGHVSALLLEKPARRRLDYAFSRWEAPEPYPPESPRGPLVALTNELADGTVTTQPEYSFYFEDVGWRVENYGTDPDIEVENTPQAYVRGSDPQLERAIATAMDLLSRGSVHGPAPAERPSFRQPQLTPRFTPHTPALSPSGGERESESSALFDPEAPLSP